MSQNKQRDHKCSHHTAAAVGGSRWHNYHFSGKVIMCSVLFGLGLVLIGGIVMAIGMDRDDGSKSDNIDEIQNKPPMSIVGPVILGIGGFTVIVGIIMCLFETNICRKRQPDARPLIEEQGVNASASSTDPAVIPSTSRNRDKHRNHKKSSSPRRHKEGCPKRSSPKDKNKSTTPSSVSPSSKPIDMQRSSSRDFTSSGTFLTPPNSFVNGNVPLKPSYCNAENQTSASLLKSFTSSGKSWTTSTEFQTPSSSLQDSSGSFEEKKKNIEASPPLLSSGDLDTKQSDDIKHEFLSPKSSNAEILDEDSENIEKNSIVESTALMKMSSNDLLGSTINDTAHKNSDFLQHEFITPQNSYVDDAKISNEIDHALDGSSISTLTNSQSQDDVEEQKMPTIPHTNPVQLEEIKVEMPTVNNHGSTENMNDTCQASTIDSNVAINSEMNSYTPIKDSLLETSPKASNIITPEITYNINTQVKTNQEINAEAQENNN